MLMNNLIEELFTINSFIIIIPTQNERGLAKTFFSPNLVIYYSLQLYLFILVDLD